MSNRLAQHVRIRLKHDILASVNVIQADTARELYFIIDDYEIPEDAEYRIYIRKPSGKEIYNYCYYANGEIVVQLTTQMCAEIGDNVGQIQIVVDNMVLTSFNFVMHVSENLIESSEIESSNEFGILDELINNARIMIEELKQLLQTVEEQEEQREENESAREEAESQRNEAEENRVSEFNQIKNEFETIKEQASDATNNANDAANDAILATNNANSAADRANAIAEDLEDAISGVINDERKSNLTTYSSEKISNGFLALDHSIYQQLKNDTNIDSVIQCGNYYASSSVTGLSGLPPTETTPFKLVVDTFDNETQVQVVNCVSSGHIYTRKVNQGAAEGWIKIATSDDIAELLELVQVSASEPVSQPDNGWWLKEV